MTELQPSAHQHLFGHERTVKQLKNAYDSGKLHHALILVGAEGIGKETVAYQLMRYALVYPQGNPKQNNLTVPESHKVFSQIENGGHTNIKIITPIFDEKRQRFARDINLEALEGMSNFLRLAPTDDAMRFILIHPAENMNRFTQNAVLKILEEPPARTIFILLTSQPGALLPTIRSRCLLVNMETLTKDEFAKGMAYFDPEASDHTIHSLYQLSQGALGRALSFEENDILDLYGDFCRAVLAWDDNDSEKAMRFAEANASSAQENTTEELYTLWLERLSQVIKDTLQGHVTEPLIPEEQHVLEIWRKVDPQTLLAGYDRLQNLWKEGVNGYLDKKLILLKALGVISGMDSAKPAVLA